MTEPYHIDTTSNWRRQAVEEWLFGLDRLSPPVREKVVTAWVSAWASSGHEKLEDMPFSPGEQPYRLMDHVNDVTRAGIDLGARAAADWKVAFDPDVLVAILILHDVDKPLIYGREGDTGVHTPLFYELPHGVIGGMLLKELGFPHTVVSTVATHATNAPFHGRNLEAHVLHYADLFAADHAFRQMGKTPLYLRHGK
ncbi:HD domain-containing protein [Siccirubricoccus phaeus]|uniref:HD domain-containing protein n=1 Tax=Siccirubricoccus phaeus TaxID=2595053 RepID=UPI0011F1CAFD|nr:HD domain-containing protein [Siccirubricoccus phaeus]